MFQRSEKFQEAQVVFKQQISNAGEKLSNAWKDGTIHRGAKNATMAATMIIGACQIAALAASGAWALLTGIIGIDVLSHKVGEKYATDLTHNNTLEFMSEMVVVINKILAEQDDKNGVKREKRRTINDIDDIAEMRALAQAAIKIVADARRNKLDHIEV
jgi:hypothetical protein